MNITRIERVIMIWYELLFKLGVSFDGLVSKKKLLLEYSNNIETHLYMTVKVLEI